MKAADLPIPGIRLGDYPERRVVLPDTAARAGRVLLARITAWCVSAGGRGPHRRFTRNVEAARAHLATVATDEFPARVTALRANLSRQGLSDAMMTQVMALVAVACERELGLRPYVTQITAARVMLDGRLAELATGEGKTLAMALAAAVAALAGIPVHLVTANDYLVARDAARLRPLFAALGLTSGAVTQPLDAAGRRCAYACDIVYCTAKELAFDYLRDGLADAVGGSALGAPGAPLLRGLCWAMIDEADSILIDEARMPLVISRAAVDAGERAYHHHALALAGQLHVGGDFSIDHEARDAALTATGRDKIEALAAPLGAVWRNRRHREETVRLGLAALHVFRRDRDYLVTDRKQIRMIDPVSGRAAPGRMWSRGLHQLIELKEGCRASGEQHTAARISYQRFFARYLRLGGMSGTLAESRAELASVYGLTVIEVAPRRPLVRTVLPPRVLCSRDAQWAAVVTSVREHHTRGRPVLIGTDSVADSEVLSRCLVREGFSPVVLNARQDHAEAAAIARAGERGAITVATNMAGRGADIRLAPGVAALGGLHVICCQHNSARRIDRQLHGRCARHGDPGSVETLLSLESPLIAGTLPAVLLRWFAREPEIRERWAARLLYTLPQWFGERRTVAEREQVLRHEGQLARRFVYGGAGE